MTPSNPKLRMRSDHELEMQNRGLQEVAMALEQLKVPFFLAEGTLLGAVREGNFIRWDWDVGIALLSESALPSFEKILCSLEKMEFDVDAVRGRSPKLNATKYGTKYELTFWKKRGVTRLRRGRRIPDRFFRTPESVEFLGRVYPCPSPAEAYLKHCYGAWQIPVMSEDTDTRRSQSLFRLLKADLRKLVKGIRR